MAGDGRPFDALGRILSGGGDVALASAMARGDLNGQVSLITRWSGWGASDSDIATVRSVAEQAVYAGQLITQQDPNQPLNFSIVPVNPLLFGDDYEGLRFYVTTDFRIGDNPKWFRGDFKMPDIFAPTDILWQMNAQVEIITDKYPDRVLAAGQFEADISKYAIQAIIRRF